MVLVTLGHWGLLGCEGNVALAILEGGREGEEGGEKSEMVR